MSWERSVECLRCMKVRGFDVADAFFVAAAFHAADILYRSSGMYAILSVLDERLKNRVESKENSTKQENKKKKMDHKLKSHETPVPVHFIVELIFVDVWIRVRAHAATIMIMIIIRIMTMLSGQMSIVLIHYYVAILICIRTHYRHSKDMCFYLKSRCYSFSSHLHYFLFSFFRRVRGNLCS